MIELLPGISVPRSELSFRATRSGGPGGQNVNKTSTRIELSFCIQESSLPDREKRRLIARLGPRLDSAGVLRIVASEQRSQLANRRQALERLREILRAALKPRVQRRKTRIPRSQKRRRLDSKRRRSETKSLRRRPPQD